MKQIIKYLAKKFLTENDFNVLMLESIETSKRSKEEDSLLFEDLKKVEGFQEYLNNTLDSDMKRYFAATTPIEQFQIKGAYSRTMYLRNKLREQGEVKLKSPRHAQ